MSGHPGMLFQHLRWRLWNNGLRQLVAASFVRLVTILLCSIIVWVFVFVISYSGFRFMVEGFKLAPDEQIIGMLLGLLFFSLGVLLVFSSGLILHGSLFTTPETAFLLAGPAPADQVFAYKFQGSLGFSSWAFLLLGGPILIAYGLVCGAPWWYYLLLPLFFLGFVLLPGSVAALCCLLIVNYLPNQRRLLLILAIGVVVLVVGLWGWQMLVEGRAGLRSSDSGVEIANTMLGRLTFANSLWLPSAWTSRGLQAAARGEGLTSLWYLALTWSNGLFLYLVAAWASSRLYRRGYNRLATGDGRSAARPGGRWMDVALSACLPFVHPGTRLLIVKDFRTFRRDPQQWGQVLLFSGLLGLYFGSVRRVFFQDVPWPYQNSISALNLCAIGLLLSTYTGRFIYPLLSLEGRKFWLLGLLPISRDQLLWGKFAFSTAGGVLLAGALMLFSDLMLEMPVDAVILHQVTVLALAAGLSGLSVGVGACLPNFRETDPSKIAVGFGGTLNLVLELLYLLVILGLFAAPWHLFRAAVAPEDGYPAAMIPVVLFCLGVGLVVAAMTVLVPLRLGVRALRRMEF
jgi:ABC-2 type transport system permease protein